MIKACIFDMDGTVLDTITTITHYVNVALQHFGLSPISEDEGKVFAGNGAYKLIERALRSKGKTDPELIKEVLDYYNSKYDEAPLYLTSPFPGILELVDELHAMGIKLAILSNKPDFVTRPIGEHFFGDKFDYIRGAVDGVALKPSPDGLIKLLADMGVQHNECAYIGDTSVDMRTGVAARAGMTIGVLWGFRTLDELLNSGADIIVKHPSQILEKIKRYRR